MAGVVAAHLLFIVFVVRLSPVHTMAPALPPIMVELVRPILPPPPPPPPEPSADRPGGGAPAAPSRVHTPPPPPVRPPDSPPAPPVQAPEPTIVVGAAPVASPEPGFGQGGQGTGTGTGVGAGDGPGSGSGPMILRGPTQGEILDFVPAEARRRRQAGRASVNCEIQLDTRLDSCRVVSETPAGFGFGDAALTIAPRYFRFRPPRTGSGQSVAGARVTVFVEFGRQSR